MITSRFALVALVAALGLASPLTSIASTPPSCSVSEDEEGMSAEVSKPHESDRWIDLFGYVPKSTIPLDPVMTTLPFNEVARELSDHGIFSLAANEQSCLDADSIRVNWSGRSTLFSRLSFLVYASEADERSYLMKRGELERKVMASEFVASETPHRSAIETSELQEKLKKLDADYCALQTRRAHKAQYLKNARFVDQGGLLDEFRRSHGLTLERLDAMQFHAELYSRDDEWVVAFRGTIGGGGWKTNLAQILGSVEAIDNGTDDRKGAIGQYEVANKLVKFLLQRGVPREKLYVTGHSLGGGLAVFSHLSNDLAGALTFNPAQLGGTSRMMVERLPHYTRAQGRIANYMSLSRDEDTKADPVSQGTSIASRVLSKFGVEVSSFGSLHGATFYVPINPPKLPASVKAKIVFGGALVGVNHRSLVKTAAIVGVASGGVSATQSDRVNGDLLAKRTAVDGGEALVVLKTVGSFSKSVPITLAKAGVGGALAGKFVTPVVDAGWQLYQLHSMEPLAAAFSSDGPHVGTTTCVADFDPRFRAEVEERRRSRLGLLKQLGNLGDKAPR